MGNAGSDYSHFRRALKVGNYEGAWMFAHQLPAVSLTDAAALIVLAAEQDPGHFEPMALRWLTRLLDEVAPSLRDFDLATRLLAEVASGDLPASKALSPLERAAQGKRLG